MRRNKDRTKRNFEVPWAFELRKYSVTKNKYYNINDRDIIVVKTLYVVKSYLPSL